MGLVLRTERVRTWAEQQTSRILAEQLGLVATFQAHVTLWPLELSVENLRVPSNDGGADALTVEQTSIRPRFFALLAGKLDVGDVLVKSPRLRAKIEGGVLKNVNYRLPKPQPKSAKPLTESPFASLSVTDASFDVTVDDHAIQTTSFDLDVVAEHKLAFEVFLRSSAMTVTRRSERQFTGGTPGYSADDEDVLCELDLRARVTTEGAVVRRLSLLGRTDGDPKPKSRPNCARLDDETDPALLALRLSSVRVDWSKPSPVIDGQVFARAPIGLVNRYVPFLPLAGWAAVKGHLRYDGKTRLPNASVKLHAEDYVLAQYHLAKELDVTARIEDDRIIVDELTELFADGHTRITDVTIAPFEPDVPFTAKRVEVKDMQFPALMRDLGVTQKTIVAWDFGDTTVTEISGHLGLPQLEGHIVSQSKDFEIFDRAYNDPSRLHMLGIPRASIDGKIVVTPKALQFRDCWASFGSSRVLTKLVSIGFDNTLEIDVPEVGEVNLADISPIATIPIAGKAKLGAKLSGLAENPVLYGTLAVKELVFGGFPVGDILSSKVKFWPLKVDITDAIAVKGKSQFTLPSARLEFDTGATVLVNAEASSKNLSIRDFLAMWNFDNDPRWKEVSGFGAVDAKIHYALGGPEDQCGTGNLLVNGQLHLTSADLFGEHYDAAEGELSFNWIDQSAGFLGFSVDAPHVMLRKGSGAVIGAFQVRPGAILTGHAIATKLPLSNFQVTAPWGAWVDTEVSAVAEIGGTLDAMTGTVRANLTPMRVGSMTLPGSDLTVTIESVPRDLKSTGTTQCGRPIPGPFDLASFEADKSDGAYRLDGQLFGGQVGIENVTFSRQKDKHVKGKLSFERLDLGSFVEALPPGLRPEQKTAASFSAVFELEDLPLAAPLRTVGSLNLRELYVEQGQYSLRAIPSGGRIRVGRGTVDVPGLSVQSSIGKAMSAVWDLSGSLEQLERVPVIHSTVRLRPVNLQPLVQVIPNLSRLSGQLGAELSIDGALNSPRVSGFLSVDKGEVELKNFELPITDIALRLGFSESELRIEAGRAKIGSGTVELKGGAPLVGLQPGLFRLGIQARGLALPERFGIRGLADADLDTVIDPNSTNFRPRLTGNVWFDGLEYNRPVAMTADVAQFAQRGRRSKIESYDPNDDFVDWDLLLFSKSPLRIRNGLIDAEMAVDKAGLQLIGTNQRYGLRGTVKAVPGGRITMRQTVFEIREGEVRFDDAERIAPRVNVKATTEYRRYSTSASATTGSSAAASGSANGGLAGATGGQWRITMHAHGDADQIRIDLTSDPALSQDDIFLLLTLGVTRAELDQAQSAGGTSVVSGVALETLGTLSGADRAVTDTIPLIDDFRFGSAYSARTGRTEPTVTIGKRLADRIRASVTSGLSESREVRSNLEWRVSPELSVEGSYDNVNDISSSQLGNLGADIRWRIEFQ